MWILYFVDTAFELGKVIDDRLEGMGGMTDFDRKVPSDKIQHLHDCVCQPHSHELAGTHCMTRKIFFEPEISDRVLVIEQHTEIWFLTWCHFVGSASTAAPNTGTATTFSDI